jgi:hypothetical protein
MGDLGCAAARGPRRFAAELFANVSFAFFAAAFAAGVRAFAAFAAPFAFRAVFTHA